jgi:hypothetical protein
MEVHVYNPSTWEAGGLPAWEKLESPYLKIKVWGGVLSSRALD